MASDWRLERAERDIADVERVVRQNETDIAVIKRDLEEIKDLLTSMRNAFYGAIFTVITGLALTALTFYLTIK